MTKEQNKPEGQSSFQKQTKKRKPSLRMVRNIFDAEIQSAIDSGKWSDIEIGKLIQGCNLYLQQYKGKRMTSGFIVQMKQQRNALAVNVDNDEALEALRRYIKEKERKTIQKTSVSKNSSSSFNDEAQKAVEWALRKKAEKSGENHF
jgi:phosphomevalonate kinase